jgi:hypothetical protein
MMTFLRQNIAPFLILLVFLFALVAVSARIFLPTDMSAPAPLTGMRSSPLTAVLPTAFEK